MAVSVTGGTRLKSATTNTDDWTYLVETSDDDGNDRSDVFVRYENLTVSAKTGDVDAANSSTTLTIVSGTPDPRINDVVSGTGIQVGTVVTAVDGATVTIDLATTQALTAETLTFTPPVTDANVWQLRLSLSSSNSNRALQVEVVQFDGTKVGEDGSGKDSAAITDGTTVSTQTFTVDGDQYLVNARVPRTA